MADGSGEYSSSENDRESDDQYAEYHYESGENTTTYRTSTHSGVEIVRSMNATLTPSNLPTGSRPGQPRGANERMEDLGRLQSDEIGHLLAWCLGGLHELLNLVPQSRQMNRGSGSVWRYNENYVLKHLKSGLVLRVNLYVLLVYKGDLDKRENRRPKIFKVYYKIFFVDGKVEEFSENLPNE